MSLRLVHNWIRTGSHWIPTYSSWPHDGTHDIEIEMVDYQCAFCGEKISEERTYSARPITDRAEQEKS